MVSSKVSTVTCNGLPCMFTCESSVINSNVELEITYNYEAYAAIDFVLDLEKEIEKLKSNMLSRIANEIGLDKTCSMQGQPWDADSNIVSLFYTKKDDENQENCSLDLYGDGTSTCFSYRGSLTARFTESLEEEDVRLMLQSLIKKGMEQEDWFINKNIVSMKYMEHSDEENASHTYTNVNNIPGQSQRTVTYGVVTAAILSFLLGSGFALRRFRRKRSDSKYARYGGDGDDDDSCSQQIGRRKGLQSYDCNKPLDDSSSDISDPYESFEDGSRAAYASKYVHMHPEYDHRQDLCTITEVSKETDSSSRATSAGFAARMVDTDSMEHFRILSESTYSDKLDFDTSSVTEI